MTRTPRAATITKSGSAGGRRAAALAGAFLAFAAVLLPGPWGSTELPGTDFAVQASIEGNPARGARLFRERDCVRCHTSPRSERGVNIPASLAEAGSRSRPGWMREYLLDPHPLRFRSEGVLPDMQMPPLVTEPGDARDLAALLATWRDSVRIPEVADAEHWASDPGLVAEGRALFAQYQCRGCHELDGSGGTVGPALDGVGRRRRAAYALALLTDPDRTIPRTAMENKNLWPEEARALTAYLMTLGGGRRSADSPEP